MLAHLSRRVVSCLSETSLVGTSRMSSHVIPEALHSVAPITTQTSEYQQTQATPDLINFGIGQPSPDLLPLDLIRSSLGGWEEEGLDPLVLQYGASSGSLSFRKTLACFLSEEYGYEVTEDELMVTCGNSQTIDLASRLFLREGDEVVMEEPSYFLARSIFDSSHAKRVAIPMDENGMIVSELEEKLEKGEIAPKLVYTIPNYQNPTGSCLPEERKKKLVELAHKFNFVVLADEPYTLLHWREGPKPSPLVQHDKGKEGAIVSAGSFSKILSPGLRLGWIHAHPSLISKFESHGIVRSGGGLNPFTSYSVQKLIASGGLKSNIETLNQVFSKRCHTMLSVLAAHLPKSCSFTLPGGGYFVWVTLPSSLLASRVRVVSKEKYGVVFMDGKLACVADPPSLLNCLRLSFAFYNEKEIEVGVKNLCSAIEECLEEIKS